MRFLPIGAAQGVVQFMDDYQKNEYRQQQMAMAKQRADMEKDMFEAQKANEARALQSQQGFGAYLNSMYGGVPPVTKDARTFQDNIPAPQLDSANQMSFPQPPAPGQASAPMQQAQTATPPPASYRTIPQLRQAIGNIQPEIASQNDLVEIDKALQSPNLNINQRGILQQERQNIVASLASQQKQGQGVPPYQTVQGAAQQQGMQPPGGMQMAASMAPPQSPAQGQSGGGGMIERYVAGLKKAGVPQEQWYQYLKNAAPFMNIEDKERLLGIREENLRRLEEQQKLRYGPEAAGQKGWQILQGEGGKMYRVNPNTNQIEPMQSPAGTGELSKVGTKKSSEAPSATALDDPQVAQFWYDKYKNDKTPPPFPWGDKAGRAAWTRLVAKKAEEEGKTGADIATGQAAFGADVGAVKQITKDISAIKPYKEMLDTNANIAIDLSKNLVQSNSKFANKTINWLKQNAGDNPDTAEYLAQMVFVQTEAARVLSNPRLVGQLTDTARKEMEEVVNGNMPINSTERVLRRIQKDGENRISAMEKQQASLMSGKGKSSGTSSPGPKVGTVDGGYRFKGGNPADQNNWEKM